MENENNVASITREEFLTNKANMEGITYEEAAQLADAEIETTLAAIPVPVSRQGDSAPIIYVRVSDYNRHASGMCAYFYTDAVKLQRHDGSKFIALGASGATAGGEVGEYTLTSGSGASAQIINNGSQIRLAFTGIYEVAEPAVRNAGMNFLFLSLGTATRSTIYHRTDVVYDTHLENA